jgi:AGZA family xanthine/uracil permease-like MFS transporter
MTVLIMPLAYSISDGISIGFVIYPLLMIVTGKAKQVHPIMYALGITFVIFIYILQVG